MIGNSPLAVAPWISLATTLMAATARPSSSIRSWSRKYSSSRFVAVTATITRAIPTSRVNARTRRAWRERNI